jgi:ApbE superfamily uncharacterized protein (UPF0280 family)
MFAFAPPVIQELTGERLHLSHGPIDVVLKAWGRAGNVRASYAAVGARFPRILPELCDELCQLRLPMHEGPSVEGVVAQRMVEACRPFTDVFVTPMAAVAGAVADELLAVMTIAAPLERAFVNDGGDIAVLTTPDHPVDIGIAGEHSRGPLPAINGSVRLDACSGVGGIATSGARGRSFSLGIADSVTVLARTAATADAAATLIANAVDIDSPAVQRRPARDLDPDSDLRDLPVTISVGPLTPAEIDAALSMGLARALHYQRSGLIIDAALMLMGETRVTSSFVSLSSQSEREARRAGTQSLGSKHFQSALGHGSSLPRRPG